MVRRSFWMIDTAAHSSIGGFWTCVLQGEDRGHTDGSAPYVAEVGWEVGGDGMVRVMLGRWAMKGGKALQGEVSGEGRERRDADLIQ